MLLWGVVQVKQFKALALKAESEGHLRQQLQTLLKLPKDKWDEAAEHAKRAVVPDNRQRACELHSRVRGGGGGSTCLTQNDEHASSSSSGREHVSCIQGPTA